MRNANVRALLLALPALLAAACGVTFSSEFEGTELFQSVRILEPERRAGMELTVEVQITNGYPVPIEVGCFYEDPDAVTEDQENLAFHERAVEVGRVVLPAHPDRRPENYKDYPREVLTFRFVAPPPGRYFIACLTPAAADNGLGVNFRVEG